MNRYRQFGQLDDVPEIIGDAGFTRLDMLADPAMLPDGALSVSENLRFDANGTSVRGGLVRQFPAGQTVGTIQAPEVFKPSADEDYLVFATANYLALFNLSTQAFSYATYPSGETVEVGDKVAIVQAGVGTGTLPQLYILRGTAKDVLQYDGNVGTVSVASGFERGNFALFVQDRIVVVQEQAIPVSDFLDFTSFTTLNQFQILKGGSDYLQTVLPYQKDYVLIGSRQGWYIAYFDPTIGAGGYAGNLQDSSFLRHLTLEAGPVGPRAAIEAMGLIWFISGGAIYAFAPQLDNQLTVLGKPLSAGIQPIMDRMSVRHAARACVERYGYRLYFALPISDVAVRVESVVVTTSVSLGITLPFYLPTFLSTNASAQVTTVSEHFLNVGDKVQLSGGTDAALNGEFTVASVIDTLNFTVLLNISSTATAGGRMKAQRLATRNNCIAVYNLNNKDWESIDWLPTGLYADWLRAVEHASQRRLMVIDEEAGPMLYEEGEADEVGAVTGGINLPFTLPINLSVANYATQPVAGRLRTRAYRWGAYFRKVRACEVRATMDTESSVTLNFLVRTPNNRVWDGERTFTASQFDTEDVPLRKMCGERGLEAQVELTTSGGRPTFRSVLVETVNVGKVEE